jgi:hypothetical protein
MPIGIPQVGPLQWGRIITRSGEVERDVVLIRPQIQIARHELAALVNADGARIAHFLAYPFKRCDDVRPAIGEARSTTGAYREKVSMTVRMRSFVPIASWSCTKSIPQHLVGA